MSLAISVTVRNAMLNAAETAIGTSPVLRIWTGSAPGIGNADSGTVLATMNLPSDWMAAASAGSKAKAGTWQDASADASGDAGHFRIYASDGTTQHIEGTVSASGGGGDLILLNGITIAAGEVIEVDVFILDV